jgi:hypothetical protein
MNCDIPDNTPRRVDTPETVQCRRCGYVYTVSLYPLRAQCSMSELDDFLASVEPQASVGLGDLVEKVIQVVTFGTIKKAPGCGCEERKNWLNKFWSWKSRQ